ncbi:MAG: glucose-6-phosphate isomerase [Candidatus Azotimanducaceae bacterium]
MIPNPTSHRIDPSSGELAGATGQYSKKLSDLAGLYEDEAAFSRAAEQSGGAIVYKVSEVRPDAGHGDLIFGTTFMEPGRIGEEFFMTRGHIHATANRPETYYGESGEGLMLLESPEGETLVLEVLPRQMIYVPPFWIHRSVNTGAAPLVMSFCYPSDSGQDYSIIERSGGMASRIVADGSGWKEAPNSSYRPRTAAEIARVYETGDHEQ